MENGQIIAILRASKADVAEIRFKAARKLDRMMVASRLARRLDTWVLRAGEERRG